LQEIFANGDTRLVNTAARGDSRLLLKRAGGKVTVAGKHGAAANVDPAYVVVDDNKTIHVIDKVLYGGEPLNAAAAWCVPLDAQHHQQRPITYLNTA
jgi:hypothetical protein